MTAALSRLNAMMPRYRPGVWLTWADDGRVGGPYRVAQADERDVVLERTVERRVPCKTGKGKRTRMVTLTERVRIPVDRVRKNFVEVKG